MGFYININLGFYLSVELIFVCVKLGVSVDFDLYNFSVEVLNV